MGLFVPLIAVLLPAPGQARPSANIDIGVTGSVSPNPAPYGAQVTYTLDAYNDGPSTATRMHLNNQFPGTLVSANTTIGRCFPPKGNYVDCDIGALPAGAHAVVTLVVTPAGVGQTTYIAFVQSADTDSNPSNQRIGILGTVDPSSGAGPVNVSVGIGRWGGAAPFQTRRRFFVTWSAIDPESDLSDVSAYDVRIRTAGPGSALSRYALMTQQPGLGWGITWVGSPGWTYCFSSRALNVAGASSAWSQDACTAVPYGVSLLRNSGSCRPEAPQAGGFTEVDTCAGANAKASAPPLRGRRFAVLVEHCPVCGVAAVSVNRRVVARINLASDSTGVVAVPVASFDTSRRVTVAIRPIGQRPIRIAGIAASAV